MNKFNQAKTKITGLVKEYKGVIITTSIAITGSLLMVTLIETAKGGINTAPKINSKPQYGLGRELDMQFVDLKTGDIIGRGGCYEIFMNDVIEIMSDFK